jgi:preprotein translocase subunit SecB
MSEPVEQQFGLQRIYVKDVSFESPQGAAIFSKTWKPSVHQEIATSSSALGEDRYEVVLTITITGKIEEQPAFVVEVQQAGIFLIKGLSDEQIRQVMGATCPNILFPYAREAADSLMVRGTLPPLLLPPINFDAMYQQALAQKTQQAGGTAH